ncbi:AAA family ATPase [Streptomyces sp. NBC_01476]|uniref:helix-turn-helix transcriptional regulator n=1 Tax=Streptomyces sp. NBC_01476 TaxID=2903881 RepID=UPI002E2FC1EF|nr:AAA family ATPase [Streptomyces sp. NBC_01476]
MADRVVAGSPLGRPGRPPQGAAPAPAERALRHLRERSGLLVYGPAGIGKSTLLGAVATAAADEGGAVLRCRPAPEDAQLPYLGLIDLFARVPDEVIAAVPPGPREALLSALRRPGPAGPPDGLAVRLAVLDALRRLADTAPVLLVVDGMQWLDGPSADVLAFVARRIDDTRIRIAVAQRVAEGLRPEHPHWCPPDTAEFPVPPLPDADVAHLLLAAGIVLPPPVQRAVLRTAAGNPFYALELSRSAPPEGLPAESGGFLPVPAALRSLVLGGVTALPASTGYALLVACAAARPTLPLLRAAGVPDASAALAAAERAGVISTDAAQSVRFRHPLVRAALYGEATEAERRTVHERLAAAVAEPTQAARHMALAGPDEDAATAAALMAAAHAARKRGEPDAAAELAELAVHRTPVTHPADRDLRLLDAADFACDAGRWEESERSARTVLDRSDSARSRVRARLVLLSGVGQALRDHVELIEDGLRDAAGAPELEAPLYHWASVRGLLTGSLDEASRHARRSAQCAAQAGDTGLRIAALSTLARVQSLAGEAADADAALAQAVELAADGPQSRGLIRMRAVLALDTDRVDDARRELAELLPAAGESDGVESTVATLVALTRAQVRAGACREALRTAARCTRVAADAGMESAPALYAAALAETFGGSAAEARRLAVRAVHASQEDGDQLFRLRALAALGQAGLFTGDLQHVAEAVESLRQVTLIGESMGAADPPLLGWYADLAEALVALGETAAAHDVLQRAYQRAGRLPGSVLASLERAEGLREAAVGRLKEGAALLRSSADRLGPLDLPVDLVRTLTALGTVERRARHRTTARALLTEARQLADRAGAEPLAERAGVELARVDGTVGGAAATALTPAEARIAELVRGGATNREVAAQLFISVKTVEGTLSRLYRRFGVRSRTALAYALASMPRVSHETHP